MSFTQFVKPYPDGYEDFESGGTPVTAAILNTNYDGFLLALNDWALQTETDIGSKADTNDVGNAFATVNGRIDSLEGTVSTKSTVTIRDLLSSGTKIGTIAINGSDYDLYAPSGGGGGSSVTWNQIQQTGTKIAEVTIDNTTYDVYSPIPIDEISDLTDVSITNLQNGQILKWNSTTSKWENSNESGGGTGGHTIIDENGTSMTARAGLQFVGADVSDDGTNDKTIVDLASAGGIDGVFIDVNNVIVQTTTFTTQASYTATEDCVVIGSISTNTTGSAMIYVDNVAVYGFYGNNSASKENSLIVPVYLRKGQTILFQNASDWQNINAYTVYGIQTGTTHSKFQPVIYSTEEREIGVWTDGKPLYQKTIVTVPTSIDYQISLSSLNIDNIVNGFGYWTRTNSNSDTQYPYGRTETPSYNSYDMNVRYTDEQKLRFIITTYSLSEIKEIRYTIQYTKTTDVAGSGSWTPQGVPAHHYSTNEQIIGTWTDGSTLYEKTITKDSISTGNNSIAHGISNFDKLVDIKGNMLRHDGKWFGIPTVHPSDITWDVGIFDVTSTDCLVIIGTKYVNSYAIDSITLTIQYTKSS